MQPIWEVHIRTVFWLVSNNGHIKVRSNQDDPDGRVSDGGDLNRSNCYRSFALVLHKLCQSTTLSGMIEATGTPAYSHPVTQFPNPQPA